MTMIQAIKKKKADPKKRKEKTVMDLMMNLKIKRIQTMVIMKEKKKITLRVIQV